MRNSKSQGYYWFKDGFHCWVNGMDAYEKRAYIREHGRIIKFVRTWLN